jgi:hypothetical protein
MILKILLTDLTIMMFTGMLYKITDAPFELKENSIQVICNVLFTMALLSLPLILLFVIWSIL